MSEVIKILHKPIAPVKIVVKPLVPTKIIRVGNSLVVQVTTVEGGALVYNETPTGAVNGSNATFLSEFDFVPGSVEVFIAIKLKPLEDYNTSGNRTITLYLSPYRVKIF